MRKTKKPAKKRVKSNPGSKTPAKPDPLMWLKDPKSIIGGVVIIILIILIAANPFKGAEVIEEVPIEEPEVEVIEQVQEIPQEPVYDSLIQEIRETDNLNGEYVEVEGEYIPYPVTEFAGFIVDKKGHRLPFKMYYGRGWNQEKTYIFKGVVGTSPLKHLNVTKSVIEVE